MFIMSCLYNNNIIYMVCLRLSVFLLSSFSHNFSVTTWSHTMKLVCAVISFCSSPRNANLMFDMPNFESLRREPIDSNNFRFSSTLYKYLAMNLLFFIISAYFLYVYDTPFLFKICYNHLIQKKNTLISKMNPNFVFLSFPFLHSSYT